MNLQAKLAKLETKLNLLKRLNASKVCLFKVIEKILKLEKIIFAEIRKRVLTFQTGRKQWRSWVAKISAKKDKVHGGYSKEFIEPVSREFNKKGETSATFEIEVDLNQIYQDSEGDFWVFANLEGEIKVISYQEVQYRFSQIPF